MSAQTAYLAHVATPMVGLTVARPGGYFQPVCLRCNHSLSVLLTRRSFALTALDIHSTDCTGVAS